ncbi:transglutaminaseTgpA domain-containing protein [Luteococcus sp. OSA5]|uniref:transglutaminase family protein n=1 Tax=Luteococcus sp. OSA5 TaxID=3401630 RepID=UPI003B43400A
MRATDRLSIAVALAMMLGAASLTPLTVDRGFLIHAAGVVVVIQAISLLGRRTNLPPLAIHAIQLVALAGIAVGLGLAAQPADGRTLAGVLKLWNDSVMQIRVQSAPMAATAGLRWLMVLLIGLVTILADLLVLTLQAVAWMLAPLLTLYLIPGLALSDDVHWSVFVLLGLGYLLVLLAHGINENAAWTRNLGSDTATKGHTTSGAARLGALVGIPVLALSLALGAVVPRLGSLDIESARPRGNSPIQMADPSIDLSKNLNLPADRVVLTYKSDQPLYLRTASLTVMDADGWHMAPVSLKDGALPTPPGLTQSGKKITTEVQVRDLSSEYLPAPYAPQSFTAEGRWRFDPQTLTILSTEDKGRTDAIRDKSYQVVSTLNDPQAETFTLAQPGTPPDAKTTASVPDNVPKTILDITHQVTKDASTPVLKAAAIQAYLASPRNFGYSTTAPPGDGFDVLTNFLTRDKTGYCVHFASAMALMARIEGIPSRVSVGFLPGEKVGDHYEVKASNMHAWPELYFADYGWVRFEPTSRVASAPEWSLVNKDVKPLPSATASGGASSKASTPSPTPSKASATPTPSVAPAPTQDEGLPLGRLLGWTAGVLGVLLLLGLPAIVRALTRRRRLSGRGDGHQQVADAWAEVRDTVHDLGHEWPLGTPRERAAGIAPLLADEGSAAMDRLSLEVERSRYARDLGPLGDLATDTRTVRQDLRSGATRTDRALALLLPRSLWKRLRGTPRAKAVETEEPPSFDDDADGPSR